MQRASSSDHCFVLLKYMWQINTFNFDFVKFRYALVFEDNRISRDMLMDLDKVIKICWFSSFQVFLLLVYIFYLCNASFCCRQEILSEIGITAMGDVINILKHAKKLHTQVRYWLIQECRACFIGEHLAACGLFCDVGRLPWVVLVIVLKSVRVHFAYGSDGRSFFVEYS